MQPGFFDLDNRYRKLDERDALVGLGTLIDWEDFRDTLAKVREKHRKSAAGRKPYDDVLMFKVLVLQHLYNLGDDEVEFQIRDRYSFCRFLKLNPEDRVPDAKTIWLFREQLIEQGLIKALFYAFDAQLEQKGFKAKKGQIVDASLVSAPIQRNSRDENAQIKNGETPERFKENPNVERQKDVEARWTEKNGQRHYGYKDHVAIDNAHKLIREYEVTSAQVHDSQVFLELLGDNTSRAVWADSAYRSAENDVILDASGYRNRVHEKGYRDNPLSERQKNANRAKSKIRARVEHVFGAMEHEMGGMFVRVIGLARATAKIGLMNLVYNIKRCVYLEGKVASAECGRGR
ncbi:MAG: IS5 family transposase [Gammaproteobacteria bacterium]|nr:IS5 family transposase [Gammaproteobacteria bacterium]